jgi:hypothetical protein
MRRGRCWVYRRNHQSRELKCNRFGHPVRKNGIIIQKNQAKFRERMANPRVECALQTRSKRTSSGTRNHAMWISLFTFATGAAVCLSVAAILMQPAGQRTLRG